MLERQRPGVAPADREMFALQGKGDGKVAVQVGSAFQRSIAALSWAPLEISRPGRFATDRQPRAESGNK